MFPISLRPLLRNDSLPKSLSLSRKSQQNVHLLSSLLTNNSSVVAANFSSSSSASSSVTSSSSTCIVPLRSVLYIPGTKAEKGKTVKVRPDGIIFDLEDAIAPESKQIARDTVIKAFQTQPESSSSSSSVVSPFGWQHLVVRINGPDNQHNWYKDDLQMVAELAKLQKIHGIVIPKVNSSKILIDTRNILNNYGVFPQSLPLWAMMETPLGILNVQSIAEKAKEVNLSCLVAGTSDLTKDLHAQHVPLRTPVLTSLSLIVLAARAYNLVALDGVHLSLDDEEGLRDVCSKGRELGFDGKTLIHPNQIEEANVAFGPTPEEIDNARTIVEAWIKNGGEKSTNGLLVINGRLIENLHIAEAKQTLQFAEILQERNKPVQ